MSGARTDHTGESVDYPAWLDRLPLADVTFPGAEGRLLSAAHGQVVFWSFRDGGSVPPHAHGPQMGVVLSGSVTLTVDDGTTTWRAGDHFFIEDGQTHSAVIEPGSRIIEVFAENDRHRARSS